MPRRSSNSWKFAFVLVAAAILGITVVGFARREPELASGKDFDVVRLSSSISDGAHLADELKLFEKNRIHIQWTGKQAHGPAAIVSLIAGQNDAAASISTAMIIARTHGSKLKIIAAQTLSTHESPLFRYYVKDGSPITGKPSDFIGKKIVASPTTITWYPIVMLMKRAAVDYQKVEFIQLPSPLAVEQALLQGSVDAIAGTPISPPASKLIAEGGVHAVPGISDYDVLGIEQIGGWAMREEYIAQHPDTVRRFVAALTEAYQWGNAHPAEAQQILNRRNEIPKEYWKYQKEWRTAPATALVNPDSIRKWIAILEEFGQIQPGSVKPEDVFTNDLNPLAIRSGESLGTSP